MSTPTDDLFNQQWHFNRIGNMSAIWEEFTGAGINVGVYDEGVQYSHFDLDNNYNAALHIVFNGNVIDGANVGNSPHGTSVAGLIGAERNGVDTVGVAYGSSITGINIFDPAGALFINAADPQGFYAAVTQSANFDVVNNSWGSTPGFFSGQNVNVVGSFAQQTVAGFENGADNGRGGLGTIIVKSSGNESRNAQGDGINNARFTIAVSAIGDSGFAASYSNHGTNILVGAPGSEFASNSGLGIVTTDLLGTDGYNLRSDPGGEHDYTDDFGGTSAAGPIVAGVTTLMLDANANLGWRDVQDILAASATLTGSSIVATTPGQFENGVWSFNSASNWNGGGMHYHVNYGYGMVNAYNAVRMAEVWSLFGPAQTSANEVTASTGTIAVNAAIPDRVGAVNGMLTTQFVIGDDINIQQVEITTNIQHTWWSDLLITLISPDGKRYMLTDGAVVQSTQADAGLVWTFNVEALRGVSSAGTWTIEIQDKEEIDSGTFNTLAVTFFGTAASTNDVYHFTDEFSLLAMLNPARRLVTDTDGGTDWLNMSAMTGDLQINLNNLAYSSVNGTQFIRIANGTVIENVITGDGDDTIFGNAENNAIYGMRGNDTIIGGAGQDTVNGGQGDDLIYVVDADIVDGGAGEDSVNFNFSEFLSPVNINLANVWNGGTGTITGGGSVTGIEIITRITGSAFSDVIVVGQNYLNTVTVAAGAGADEVIGGFGANNLRGEDGDDTLIGGDAADSLNGGNNNDRLEGRGGDDVLIGGDGDDNLAGGGSGDIDELRGGGGNDTYRVQDSGDLVIEAGNAGTDDVRSIIDYILVDNVERLFISGAARSATGNALSNSIFGSGGADTLSGLGGDDTIRGGIGRDIIDGGIGQDLIDGGAGKDTMTGGADRDTFQFRFLSDLNATATFADVITDFDQGLNERIIVSDIDANTATVDNDSFEWISTNAFSNTAGEMRYEQVGGDTIISGDVNGDGVADLMIRLNGLYTLSAADIIGASDLQPNNENIGGLPSAAVPLPQLNVFVLNPDYVI
jgi:Ca2+-binding RTX toxin-like protein